MNIFVVYRVKKYFKNLITVIIEKTVCQHLKLFFFQMEIKPMNDSNGIFTFRNYFIYPGSSQPGE